MCAFVKIQTTYIRLIFLSCRGACNDTVPNMTIAPDVVLVLYLLVHDNECVFITSVCV